MPPPTPAIDWGNLVSKPADVLGSAYKQTRSAFGKLPSGILTLGTLALASFVVYAYAYESDDAITKDMVGVFAKGVDGLTPKDANVLVERDELLTSLRTVLAPTEITNYVVILGEKGVAHYCRPYLLSNKLSRRRCQCPSKHHHDTQQLQADQDAMDTDMGVKEKR